MSPIIEQAEQLRQQAIGLLLAERQQIDQKLTLLGHDGAATVVSARTKGSCSVCGSAGHKARFHRNETPEGIGLIETPA